MRYPALRNMNEPSEKNPNRAKKAEAETIALGAGANVPKIHVSVIEVLAKSSLICKSSAASSMAMMGPGIRGAGI